MQVSKRKLVKRIEESMVASRLNPTEFRDGYIYAIEEILAGKFGLNKRAGKAAKDFIHLCKTNLSLFE